MLKRILPAIAASILIISPSLRGQEPVAAPNTWTISTTDSYAHFTVTHLMISKVKGTFGGVKGTVVFDPKNPAKGSVEATVDVSTVNTGVAKRDAQIKDGPDFFDSKKFPLMLFKSKKVAVVAKGKLRVTGDLTMNGITREAVFAVDWPFQEVTDAQGRVKSALTATTTVNRQDYNVTYKELMGTGDLAVANKVLIELDVELVKNLPTGAPAASGKTH